MTEMRLRYGLRLGWRFKEDPRIIDEQLQTLRPFVLPAAGESLDRLPGGGAFLRFWGDDSPYVKYHLSVYKYLTKWYTKLE